MTLDFFIWPSTFYPRLFTLNLDIGPSTQTALFAKRAQDVWNCHLYCAHNCSLFPYYLRRNMRAKLCTLIVTRAVFPQYTIQIIWLANDLALNFPKFPWISFLGNFRVKIFLKFEKGNAIQPMEVVRAYSVKERCAHFWSKSAQCVKNARGICSARTTNNAVWPSTLDKT
jgi:hypothetical protein